MFNKLRGLGLVLLVLVWIAPAHAVIPWTVVDTYTETVKTFSSKALPGNVTTETETSTEQYKDANGNTVEKTTTKTYEVKSDIIEKVVQKRQVFKMEKINKAGQLKTKTHKGATFRETVRESSGETRTLVNTAVTERITEYAKVEEPTKVVSSDKTTNVAVNLYFGDKAQY